MTLAVYVVNHQALWDASVFVNPSQPVRSVASAIYGNVEIAIMVFSDGAFFSGDQTRVGVVYQVVTQIFLR